MIKCDLDKNIRIGNYSICFASLEKRSKIMQNLINAIIVIAFESIQNKKLITKLECKTINVASILI